MHLRAISLLFLAALHPGYDLEKHDRPDFEAARLQPGTFQYRDSQSGKTLGESVITVKAQDPGSTYSFSNIVKGPSSQQWRVMTSSDFAPLSAELTFGDGVNAHKAFQLSYHATHVTGSFAVKREDGGYMDRPVDAFVASDTIDQRIDWAATMSLASYSPRQNFSFHVYDPKGGNSPVLAKVLAVEEIHVSAGTFHVVRIAYRIQKATGPETFVVFVKESSPRFLVKEIFPDGVISELSQITPY